MTNDPQALRRYLLGTASDIARDALEDGYFASDAARAEMEDAEDALVESYLDGTLAANERAAFERHYLAAPTRRRRVRVARELRRAAARRHSPAHWSWLGLAAAAMLAITVGGLVWMSRVRTPPRTDAPSVAQAPAVPPGPAAGNLPRAPVVVSLAVPSITVRGGGGPPTARMPPDADVLALRLLADPGRPSPGAPIIVVETVEGMEVWQGPGTVSDGVQVSVPAGRLAAGDYLASVFETSGERRVERGQYFFRVQAARP